MTHAEWHFLCVPNCQLKFDTKHRVTDGCAGTEWELRPHGVGGRERPRYGNAKKKGHTLTHFLSSKKSGGRAVREGTFSTDFLAKPLQLQCWRQQCPPRAAVPEQYNLTMCFSKLRYELLLYLKTGKSRSVDVLMLSTLQVRVASQSGLACAW